MDRPRPKSCVSTASSGSVLSLRALRKRLEETTTSFPNNHKTRNDQAIDGINGFKSNRPVTTQMASNEDSVAQLIQRRSRSNSAVHLQRTRAFSSRNTRSISAVELPSRATSRLKEHEEEEEDEDAIPDEVAGLQGIKLYERRRSALPKLDTNGNISYAQRKNMRRGSLFYAQSRPRSKMVEMDTDDEVEDVSLSDQMTIPGLAAKRQSLQIPSQLYFSNDKRRRSRSDSIRSGGSSERLDMMTEDGPPVNFNRRRRGSRMPASLAKDVEMLVPPVRKSNPVSYLVTIGYWMQAGNDVIYPGGWVCWIQQGSIFQMRPMEKYKIVQKRVLIGALPSPSMINTRKHLCMPHFLKHVTIDNSTCLFFNIQNIYIGPIDNSFREF